VGRRPIATGCKPAPHSGRKLLAVFRGCYIAPSVRRCEELARQAKPPAPPSLQTLGQQGRWGRRFRLPGRPEANFSQLLSEGTVSPPPRPLVVAPAVTTWRLRRLAESGFWSGMGARPMVHRCGQAFRPDSSACDLDEGQEWVFLSPVESMVLLAIPVKLPIIAW